MTDILMLFWVFFKIGLFTIGGGNAMIPLINSDIAECWPELSGIVPDLLGISQMTPGAFAINAATFTGMSVAGVGGALAATLGVITPSLIITSIVARIFNQMRQQPLIKKMLYGVRPVVVGLIAGTVLEMIPASWFAAAPFTVAPLNLKAMLITIAATYAILRHKLSPVIVVLVSAVVGIFFFV